MLNQAETNDGGIPGGELLTEQSTTGRRARSKSARVMLALAAAHALRLISEWIDPVEDETSKRVLARLVRDYFRAQGVRFDSSGRPFMPGMFLNSEAVLTLHQDAIREASRAIQGCQSAGPPDMGGEDGDDLVLHSVWQAFNAGVDENVEIGLGGGEMRAIRPEAHAVDRVTGKCMGRQSL